MKVAIYIRISTVDQNAELQLREIARFIERREWTAVGTYQDIMSGSKAKRPGLLSLMEDCRLRNVDCVCVWKLDRFGRSLVDCLNNMESLKRYGVRFVCVTQNIDTDESNPASTFMLQMLGAAAEFERSLILERSKAGQKRYREDYAKGVARSRSGKNMAPHRPRRIFDREKVLKLREGGKSIRQIAKAMGVGRGTVERVLKFYKPCP